MQINKVFSGGWLIFLAACFGYGFYTACNLLHTSVRFTVLLPKPSGKFSVGTRAVLLEDRARAMLRDENARRWLVQAFYPTEPHAQRYFYMPGTLKEGQIEDAQVFASSRPDAAILETTKKYPVLLVIPGRGGLRQDFTILCEELASHGYLVLVTELPYIANYVKFLDGTTVVPTLYDAWNIDRNRTYRYEVNEEVVRSYISDILFILSELEDGHLGELSAVANLKKIAILGHSLGGNAAGIVGLSDPRITAVVDLDSVFTDLPICNEVGPPQNSSYKPILFIRAMLSWQRPDILERFSSIRASTTYVLRVAHSAFCDGAFLAPRIKKMLKQNSVTKFLKWFFKTGPHWGGEFDLGEFASNFWFRNYPKRVRIWLNRKLSLLKSFLAPQPGADFGDPFRGEQL